MVSEYVLQMEHIVKTFPGVIALKDVSFNVKKGSVHALVGENGAGKSTLMKILSGNYQPDSGEIYIDGKKVEMKTPKDAMRLGVSMVHQELSPVPEMSIAENMFLGREPRTKLGLLNKNKINRMAKELLEQFHLSFDVSMPIKNLSVANMQMIEIIKAMSVKAKIIVLDEPTSSITDKEVETLFEFIHNLKRRGVTLIYISHRMEELEQIADEFTILRDGETITTRPVEGATKDDIIRLMVGRELKQYYPKGNGSLGETVLKVENLTKKGVFEKVSFEVKSGEIVGISGLVGAGRTELVSAIFGLMPYDSGEIYVEGKRVKIKNTRNAIDQGIALIPEDRKGQGLVLGRSIGENITLPFLNKYNRFNLNKRQESEDIRKQMKHFAVKAPSEQTLAKNLSGGNQQKVVLAKWLLLSPKILILDEPTRGIDVGAKQEIYRYMRELSQKGIATVMVSSELPEILGMSDRILVMSGGHMTGELSGEEADSEKVMYYAMEGM